MQRKFTGHEYDRATSLTYANARYYKQNIGRFVSQDPVFLVVGNDESLKAKTGLKLRTYLQNPQAFNSYSYAIDNPMRVVDAGGEWIEYIIGDQNAVSLGNWANNLYNSNSVASYAMDHPIQTGAAAGILGGAAVAGGIVAGGGSITCGILCGPAATVITGGTAAMTRAIPQISNLTRMDVVQSAQQKLEGVSQKLGMSSGELLQKAMENGQRYIDTKNSGNINVFIQRAEDGFIRVTTNPEFTRIISAGLNQTKDVVNGIESGRFIPVK